MQVQLLLLPLVPHDKDLVGVMKVRHILLTNFCPICTYTKLRLMPLTPTLVDNLMCFKLLMSFEKKFFDMISSKYI